MPVGELGIRRHRRYRSADLDKPSLENAHGTQETELNTVNC